MTKAECERIVRFAVGVSHYRHRPVQPDTLCRLIELSRKIKRLNERQASDSGWREVPHGVQRTKLIASASEIAHAIDAKLDVNLDPRGWPLKLVYPEGEVSVPVL